MAPRLLALLCLLLAIPAVVPIMGDGQAASNRRLIWSDDFSGPAGARPDPAKWSFDIGGNGWGNNELQYYTSRPENASLDGHGDLVITAHAGRYTGSDGVTRRFTSARLLTRNKFAFRYGEMEARIRVPAGQGLLPAFWALAQKPHSTATGPSQAEIDAMEVLGSSPDVVHGTIHGPWLWAPNGIGGWTQAANPLSASFHTYGVRWSSRRISFLLDGTVYKTLKPSDLRPGSRWPFRRPSFLLLNLAVGGKWPGAPDASTHFPARMVVDWVRVWQ